MEQSHLEDTRVPSPEELIILLRLRLPALEETLRQLEGAKKVPRETLEIQFTI